MVHSRLLIGLAVGVVLIVSLDAWGQNANKDIAQLEVANKTTALLVESVAELGNVPAGKKQIRRFKITVKNGYPQPVVAYSFNQKDNAVGEGSNAGTEMNGSTIGWTLAPDATHATEFYTASEGTVVLTLAAVLLKDGSGDGDAETLSRLKEVRAGVKLAYEQIIPLLGRASESNENSGSATVVQSLEEEITRIADERKVDVKLRRGFRNAKDLVLADLHELKARPGPYLEYPVEISKIKTRVEDVLKDL